VDSTHIPFSFPDVYQGLASGGGIATATTAGLTLEYQVKDGVFGVIKSGVHKVAIPISDLHSVRFKPGWFRNRLFIKVRTMATLADVPGSDRGQLELRVARADKRAAQSLVSVLMLTLSEKQIAELER
jgi:hypothetical protein